MLKFGKRDLYFEDPGFLLFHRYCRVDKWKKVGEFMSNGSLLIHDPVQFDSLDVYDLTKKAMEMNEFWQEGE